MAACDIHTAHVQPENAAAPQLRSIELRLSVWVEMPHPGRARPVYERPERASAGTRVGLQRQYYRGIRDSVV